MVVSWPRPRRRRAASQMSAEAEAAVSNTMSSMILQLQASESATVEFESESDGNENAAALGDREVTLRGLASHNTDTSNTDIVLTRTKDVVVMVRQDTGCIEMVVLPKFSRGSGAEKKTAFKLGRRFRTMMRGKHHLTTSKDSERDVDSLQEKSCSNSTSFSEELGDGEVTLRGLATHNTDTSNSNTDIVLTRTKDVVIVRQDTEFSRGSGAEKKTAFKLGRQISTMMRGKHHLTTSKDSERDVDGLQEKSCSNSTSFSEESLEGDIESSAAIQTSTLRCLRYCLVCTACGLWYCQDCMASEDAASTNSNDNDSEDEEDEELPNFVDEILSLSLIDCAADFIFRQLQCSFPDVVEDANEILTTEYEMMVEEEEEEEDEKEEESGALLAQSDDSGSDQGEGDDQGDDGKDKDIIAVFAQSDDRGSDQREGDDQGDNDKAKDDIIVIFDPHLDEEEVGGVGQDEEETDNDKAKDDIIVIFDPHLDEEEVGGVGQDEKETDDDKDGDLKGVFDPHLEEEEVGGVGQDEEEADEHEEDDVDVDVGEGEEIVVDVQKDSLETDVVLGRWAKMQHQFDTASYSPGEGFVLRKDGKMPELSEDEVLIRVDATAVSTRDCLERLRRDDNDGLKDDVWVPGHEIVGHVVNAGSGMEAKSLLDKRIASILPYGGGCSQYVCIHAKDAIALPEGAGSDYVVGLLSTYMIAYQCLECVAGIESKEGEDDDAEANDYDAEANDDDDEAEVSPSNNMGDAEQKRSHLFGKDVLIVDSGSPVGLALVNLATNAGATVHTATHLISTSYAIRWRGCFDLIIDVVGGSDNNPSFYKIMKTRGRLVRVNITSCKEKYVPRALAGKIEDGEDTSYYERVINDKAIDYDIFHSFNEDKEVFAEDLAYLTDLRLKGSIEPIIFSQAGFDELEFEWGKLMAEEGNGVVVVSPWKLGSTTVIDEGSSREEDAKEQESGALLVPSDYCGGSDQEEGDDQGDDDKDKDMIDAFDSNGVEVESPWKLGSTTVIGEGIERMEDAKEEESGELLVPSDCGGSDQEEGDDQGDDDKDKDMTVVFDSNGVEVVSPRKLGSTTVIGEGIERMEDAKEEESGELLVPSDCGGSDQEEGGDQGDDDKDKDMTVAFDSDGVEVVSPRKLGSTTVIGEGIERMEDAKEQESGELLVQSDCGGSDQEEGGDQGDDDKDKDMIDAFDPNGVEGSTTVIGEGSERMEDAKEEESGELLVQSDCGGSDQEEGDDQGDDDKDKVKTVVFDSNGVEVVSPWKLGSTAVIGEGIERMEDAKEEESGELLVPSDCGGSDQKEGDDQGDDDKDKDMTVAFDSDGVEVVSPRKFGFTAVIGEGI